MASHRLATLALGPLLVAQGLYVRRVIPRLPEAAGPREGVAGSGPELRLLIAGDSAAAGVGVATQAEALSGQLVAALATSFRVSWKLVATTGHRAEDVLNRLAAEPAAAFDVAVTSTGVNDVTGFTPLARWLELQGRLVELLRTRFQVRQVLLSGVPPMHVFPALPQPLRWWLGQGAARLNAATSAWVPRSGQCEFVELVFPPGENYMADDGFHPGAAAYRAWAELLAQRIRTGCPLSRA
jgi:lysophospholipase L1-like esterase